MFVLMNGLSVPFDFYIGGSHIAGGEREPNISPSIGKAKRYNTYEAASKKAKELNQKYSYGFEVYDIHGKFPSAHGYIQYSEAEINMK